MSNQVRQGILLLDKHFIRLRPHQLQIPTASSKLTILQVYCRYTFCQCLNIAACQQNSLQPSETMEDVLRY